MSSDIYEYDDLSLFFEYRAVISGDVDAPTTGESFLDGVIVEKRMEGLCGKEPQSFGQLLAHRSREFIPSLCEPSREVQH